MNPNLNMDWINNPNLNESDLMEISENCGYDILIGANNGEEVRRANSTIKWKNDQEINSIYNLKPEPEPTPEPTPGKNPNKGKVILYIPNNEVGEKVEVQVVNNKAKFLLDNNWSWDGKPDLYQDIGVTMTIAKELNNGVTSGILTGVIQDPYNSYDPEALYARPRIDFKLYFKEDSYWNNIVFDEYNPDSDDSQFGDFAVFIPTNEEGAEVTLVIGDYTLHKDDVTELLNLEYLYGGEEVTLVSSWESTDKSYIYKGTLETAYIKEDPDTPLEMYTDCRVYVTDVKDEKYYGDIHIKFTSDDKGNPTGIGIIQASDIVDGYTPLKFILESAGGWTTIIDVFRSGFVPEQGGNIYYGYNIWRDISDYINEYGWLFNIKFPNGYIDELHIPASNIIVDGSGSGGSVSFDLHENYVTSNVDIYLNDIDLTNSGFTPARLMQNVNGAQVILVDGFTNDGDGHCYGTLTQSAQVPGTYTYDNNDEYEVGEPYLIMSESVTVIEEDFESDDPQYSEPTLYLGSDAVLLLEDELLSNNLFGLSTAYQINSERWEDIAESFSNNDEFIYNGSLGSYTYDSSYSSIITLICNQLEGDIPNPKNNYPDFYYDSNNCSTGDTITLRLGKSMRNQSDLFTPGDLMISNEDTILVSAGSWTPIGYGAFTATLENNYSSDYKLEVEILVYDEYTGITLECDLHDTPYVAPTPNKCYIGSNQEGGKVTVEIGTYFMENHPNITIEEDTYLVRLADGNDNTITESFSSSDNPHLYVGTISEPVSDPSQPGEIELTYINPDSDEYYYTESVIFVEEDYPEE